MILSAGCVASQVVELELDEPTFRDNDVELDDVKIVEGTHNLAVGLCVLLGGVCVWKSRRREERVAGRTEVGDGRCALVVLRRVRDLRASETAVGKKKKGRKPETRRERRFTSMYSSTTLTFASSWAVKLDGKLSMTLATPKRSLVCAAVKFTMGMVSGNEYTLEIWRGLIMVLSTLMTSDPNHKTTPQRSSA